MSNHIDTTQKPYHLEVHKGLVFYGPSAVGKTRKAREIAATYSHRNVHWINALSAGKKHLGNKISKAYKYCESPQLIVIDDIPAIVPIDFFYQWITDGITVELLERPSYKIYPKIILIYADAATRDYLERCPSDSRRFDYVDFSSAPEVEAIEIQKPFRLIYGPKAPVPAALPALQDMATPKIARSFHLTEEENQRFLDWSKSLPDVKTGPIRGEYSFIFNPTTLGDIVRARRSDGHSIDLTNYDSF